jgi:heme/copper-type cytochrome/quinol oxidase subunit 1
MSTTRGEPQVTTTGHKLISIMDVSFWLFLFGGLVAMGGFVVPGGAAAFGGTADALLSDAVHSPGTGGDLWIMVSPLLLPAPSTAR